jgi:hypothetical protein
MSGDLIWYQSQRSWVRTLTPSFTSFQLNISRVGSWLLKGNLTALTIRGNVEIYIKWLNLHLFINFSFWDKWWFNKTKHERRLVRLKKSQSNQINLSTECLIQFHSTYKWSTFYHFMFSYENLLNVDGIFHRQL